MSVRFDVDLSSAGRELDRLARGPAPRIVLGLESVFLAAFQETQQIVHVITGSLRGSGKPETSFDGEAWEGTVFYGGASPGFPNDPVNYAIYELARGGSHNFFGPMYRTPDQIRQVIMEHLRGD